MPIELQLGTGASAQYRRISPIIRAVLGNVFYSLPVGSRLLNYALKIALNQYGTPFILIENKKFRERRLAVLTKNLHMKRDGPGPQKSDI